MPYVTVRQAIARSRRSWSNPTIAESAIRKSARTPDDTSFDIFLSHSYRNAEVIAGIKGLIEDQGQTVYVDWINDPEADRSYVTPATADMLRHRMKHCNFLLYASSNEARESRWMPWELGYFDGMKPGHVGIVPIVASEDDTFPGQEYLGLYPHFGLIDIEAMGLRLAMDIDSRTARLIKSAVCIGTSRT